MDLIFAITHFPTFYLLATQLATQGNILAVYSKNSHVSLALT